MSKPSPLERFRPPPPRPHRAITSLSAEERGTLRALAAEHGLTEAEVLRIGLQTLADSHRATSA